MAGVKRPQARIVGAHKTAASVARPGADVKASRRRRRDTQELALRLGRADGYEGRFEIATQPAKARALESCAFLHRLPAGAFTQRS